MLGSLVTPADSVSSKLGIGLSIALNWRESSLVAVGGCNSVVRVWEV